MKRYILYTILSFFNYFSFAATRTWIGAGGGGAGTDLALAANWNGGTALLTTDDYTMTLNNFAANVINYTQSAALTFKSLVIIWTATGNGLGNQRNGLFTISNNFTITNNFDLRNTGTTGNWNHPIEWSVTGGTSNYGSMNMSGGGLGQGGAPDLLTIRVTSPGIINCLGALTLDNPSAFFSRCYIQNGGTMNIYGTTTFNNLQSANSGDFHIYANDGGRFNFHGNVVVSNNSNYNTNFGSASAVQSTGTFYFYRDVDMGSFGRTFTGSNNAGTFVFDSTGAQTLTCSNASLKFSNVKIGDINSPTVTLAGSPGMGNSATTSNLSVNNSAVLVIPSGYTLNRDVSGGTFSITSKGTLKVGGTTGGITGSNFPNLFSTNTLDSTSTVEFTGASQTIPGTTQLVTSYGNLTTSGSGTKTLGSDIAIYRQLSLGSSTALTLGNYHATLKSNSKTTAYVAALTSPIINYGSTAGSGRFIVERYISYPRKWQFISVPTDSTQTIKSAWQEGGTLNSNPVAGYGMQITNGPPYTGTGFDATSPAGPSLKYYNPAAPTLYTGITNTTDTVNTTKGYMAYIRGDRTCLGANALSIPTTLRTKGKLYTGIQTTININTGAFASIGNPYAAPINLLNLSMTGLSGTLATKGTVYLWDPSLSGIYGLGAFQTLTFNTTSLTYDITPGGGLYTGNTTWARVESGQAFYVKGGVVAGTVIFDEAAKGFGSALVLFPGPQPDMSRMLRANLYGVPAGVPALVDGVLSYFDNAFPNGADNMDAEKIGNTGENLGLRSAGRILAVDYRNIPNENDTLFLNTANLRAQHYILEIKAANLQANGRTAFLEDTYMQKIVPLDLNGNVSLGFDVVNVPGSYAVNRFRIWFKQEIFPFAITKISAERSSDKTGTVKWNTENEINVVTMEIEKSTDKINYSKLGNSIPQNNNAVAAYSFNDGNASLNDNYYRVKSTEMSGIVKYSDIAKIGAVADINKGVSIFPNPVSGGKLNIHFTNQTPGNYSITVYNSAGAWLCHNEIKMTDPYSTKAIPLKPDTVRGSYRAIIITPMGMILTLPFIVL